VQVLRLTARWSFLLFWLAYTGGAMATIFGPTFKPIAMRVRELGLPYAAAQLVHLGLVVWRWRSFLLAGSRRLLGSRGWRALRIVGVSYILLALPGISYQGIP
jgi:hypothetical protein